MEKFYNERRREESEHDVLPAVPGDLRDSGCTKGGVCGIGSVDDDVCAIMG